MVNHESSLPPSDIPYVGVLSTILIRNIIYFAKIQNNYKIQESRSTVWKVESLFLVPGFKSRDKPRAGGRLAFCSVLYLHRHLLLLHRHFHLSTFSEIHSSKFGRRKTGHYLTSCPFSISALSVPLVPGAWCLVPGSTIYYPLSADSSTVY